MQGFADRGGASKMTVSCLGIFNNIQPISVGV